MIKQRAERVVNGIDGPDGANYADHDGDGTIEEIGDGQGAIFHANDAITHANLASGGSGNDPTVSEHAAVLVVNAQSSIDFMAVARDSAISNVLGATSASAAKLSMGIVVGLIGNALNGLDTDADGEFVGLGETGAVHAYREGQLMATYSFPGGEVEPEVEPPATGDSAVPLLAQIGVGRVSSLPGGGWAARTERPTLSAASLGRYGYSERQRPRQSSGGASLVRVDPPGQPASSY